MTITFSAGDEPPVDLEDFVEGLLKDASLELARVVSSLRTGKVTGVRSVPALAKEAKTAFYAVNDLRGKIEKLRKQSVSAAGPVGTGALDLHAARDEIGRRLACLRDAGPG